MQEEHGYGKVGGPTLLAAVTGDLVRELKDREIPSEVIAEVLVSLSKEIEKCFHDKAHLRIHIPKHNTEVAIDFAKKGKNRWIYKLSAYRGYTPTPGRGVMVKIYQTYHYLTTIRRGRACELLCERFKKRTGIETSSCVKVGRYTIYESKGFYAMIIGGETVVTFEWPQDNSKIEHVANCLAYTLLGKAIVKALETGEWPEEILAALLSQKI